MNSAASPRARMSPRPIRTRLPHFESLMPVCSSVMDAMELALHAPLIFGLEERDLHAVRVLQAYVTAAPRGHDRRMHQRGPFGDQGVHGGLHVGDAQGEADRSAEALA